MPTCRSYSNNLDTTLFCESCTLRLRTAENEIIILGADEIILLTVQFAKINVSPWTTWY